MKKQFLSGVAVATLSLSSVSVQAQSREPIRIGFISDMSGAYQDTDGTGGSEAIKMAVEDFGDRCWIERLKC